MMVDFPGEVLHTCFPENFGNLPKRIILAYIPYFEKKKIKGRL
jgi:hypothetical protein